MFGAVRRGILVQKWKTPFQHGRDTRINRYVAERRFPIAFAHDGQRLCHTSMVGTHQDAVRRNLQAREYRSGHVTGIHVTCMGHNATQSVNDFVAGGLGNVGTDFLTQGFGIAWIKASGDCGKANGRHGRSWFVTLPRWDNATSPLLNCARRGTAWHSASDSESRHALTD